MQTNQILCDRADQLEERISRVGASIENLIALLDARDERLRKRRADWLAAIAERLAANSGTPEKERLEGGEAAC